VEVQGLGCRASRPPRVSFRAVQVIIVKQENCRGLRIYSTVVVYFVIEVNSVMQT
jgi:hypothetical protein